MVKYFTNSKLLQICQKKQHPSSQNDRNSVNNKYFKKQLQPMTVIACNFAPHSALFHSHFTIPA